ncbi:hypothetical protein C0Q70_13030 [Pomacea canaliculata]|uniref:SRCR domain-containing protein n=1 Tax=Pomacea canaliculata TaxID=400727 RepID=A0A2T7P356_POMCA|nr:hypothetical protein C0Q70_13030 [Pomacea canaliculata]
MGRVEILLGAAWTTPCVSSFSSSLAKVICRQMNFSSQAAASVEPSSFGPRKGRFFVAGIVCTGMESNILDCFQTVTGFSDTCSSPELGVICSDYRPVVRIKWEGNACEPLESSPSRYSSQVLNFQVNEEMQWVVTVPEHSRVYMRCEAEGRPSPHMTIVRDTGDKREVASRPRGALQLTDQRVVLTYNLTAAPYEASGNYRCEVDNGVGKDIQSIRIYVVCKSTAVYLLMNNKHVFGENRSYVLNFKINAEARTVVTVAEKSSVRMRCEAEGRPSPHMTIVSVSNDKQEVASRPRGAVELYDQSVELTYDLTAAPCEAAGDYRCEVDNGLAEDRGVNVKVIIGAAVGTAAVLVKSLSRHAEANTRQALETTVPLENMKSSGATNNYYGQNARSEVMNMPQEKDIMTEDLYVNTAELAREEYDSDHEYSDVDDIDSF